MRRPISLVIFLLAGLNFVLGQESIRLGPPGKEGELITPRQIKEGPDGNIYTYDEVDACIKVYSPLGKFLKKIGGQGQGPGEIQRREGVSLGFTPEGKLFFTEFFGGHRWITLLELSGEFFKVLKFELTRSLGILHADSLPDGGYVAGFYFSSEAEKHRDYYLYRSPIDILRLNAYGRIVSEIKRTAFFDRISFIPTGGDSGLPFSPRITWCLTKDKNALIYADGLNTNLVVYSLDGKLIKEIKTELPAPEMAERSKEIQYGERPRMVPAVWEGHRKIHNVHL